MSSLASVICDKCGHLSECHCFDGCRVLNEEEEHRCCCMRTPQEIVELERKKDPNRCRGCGFMKQNHWYRETSGECVEFR